MHFFFFLSYINFGARFILSAARLMVADELWRTRSGLSWVGKMKQQAERPRLSQRTRESLVPFGRL